MDKCSSISPCKVFNIYSIDRINYTSSNIYFKSKKITPDGEASQKLLISQFQFPKL